MNEVNEVVNKKSQQNIDCSLVWWDRREAVCVLSAVELPGVLLEVEVPAEALVADLAGERLLLVVRVHVEGKVVDLKRREVQFDTSGCGRYFVNYNTWLSKQALPRYQTFLSGSARALISKTVRILVGHCMQATSACYSRKLFRNFRRHLVLADLSVGNLLSCSQLKIDGCNIFLTT